MTPQDLKQFDALLEKRLNNFATKDDLKSFATKKDLEKFATKDDLKKELSKYLTKEDLRSELRKYATKKDLRKELSTYATNDDVKKESDRVIKEISDFIMDLANVLNDKKADKEDLRKVEHRVNLLEEKTAA